MEEVKEVINGIDRRLGVHINIVSENLGKVAHMVEEVRDVLLDDTDPQIDIDGSNQSHNGPRQHSKFDKLLSSMHPLLGVRTNIMVFKMFNGSHVCIKELFVITPFNHMS